MLKWEILSSDKIRLDFVGRFYMSDYRVLSDDRPIKIGSLTSSKCCMLFHQNTRNTVKVITCSELNHPSLSKRLTGCTRQDLGREHSILLSVTHMVCISQVLESVLFSDMLRKLFQRKNYSENWYRTALTQFTAFPSCIRFLLDS